MRLEQFEGGGWIEVSANGEAAERAQDAPGDWIEVAAGATDADGRCRDLARDAASGAYRLTFDTGAYFARARAAPASTPKLPSPSTATAMRTITCPLLLSDNSYTTYQRKLTNGQTG